MQAELMTVADYVDKIALSHPNIRFVLTNNGSTMLNTDGKGDLLKTINSVFGINVARNMIKSINFMTKSIKITENAQF